MKYFKRLFLTLLILGFTSNLFALGTVRLGPSYFPETARGRPVALGSIYVGQPDLDPSILANQKQLSVRQESGTVVTVSQPISTSAGGIPLYLGSPVTLLVDGYYSLKVLDSSGTQVYYVPSSNPDALGAAQDNCYPDYNAVNQGLTGDNDTIKYCVDTYGSDQGTIVLRHNSGSATTTYTLTTSETIPANITLKVERGAVIDGAGTLSFAIGNNSVVSPEWWGAVPDGSTDCLSAFQKAYASLTAGVIQLETGTYKISAGLDHNKNDIILQGRGRYSTFIKNYGSDETILVGNVGVTRINRFGIKDLSLQGNGTATYGVYLQNVGYGEIRDTFIESHTDGGIKFQDCINIDIIHNNIYGPGAAVASSYGYEFVKVVSNNTAIRSENNYITGWYSDIRFEDYSIVGFQSFGDILEATTDGVYIGTNNRNVNFIGPSFEGFTTAFKLLSGNVTIKNTEGINWGDIDFTGMTGADLLRSDWLISIPAYPAGGTAYDAATNGSYHKLGHMISDGRGIITHDVQSRAKAYVNVEQTTKNGIVTLVNYDAEIFDSQGEFEARNITGTATATTVSKLVDSGATFTTALDPVFTLVGATIWNTTDNTYTTITAVDDANTLSLTADIMANGETYKIFRSRFTALVTGYYQVNANIYWKTPVSTLGTVTVYKNDATAIATYSTTLGETVMNVSDIVYLTVGDFITVYTQQNSGGDLIIDDTQSRSFISIHKSS